MIFVLHVENMRWKACQSINYLFLCLFIYLFFARAAWDLNQSKSDTHIKNKLSYGDSPRCILFSSLSPTNSIRAQKSYLTTYVTQQCLGHFSWLEKSESMSGTHTHFNEALLIKTQQQKKWNWWIDGWICKYLAQNHPVLLTSNYDLRDELAINFFSTFNTMLTAAQSWNIMNNWIDRFNPGGRRSFIYSTTLQNQWLLMAGNADYKHQNL